MTYTTLGSTVVNSSLTSLGTLTSLGVNAGTTGRVYINVAPASTYSSWTVNMDDIFADFDLITEEIRIMTSTGEIVGQNIGTMYGSGTFKVGGTTVLNLTTLGSTVVNSSLENIIPSGGAIYIGNALSTHIQIGSTSTYIDFTTQAGTDYNARIRATGGTAGVNNSATLTYNATTHNFVGSGGTTVFQIGSDGGLIGTTTSSIPLRQFYSALASGSAVEWVLGKSGTTNEAGSIRYNYSTTPSSNKIGLGFWANTNLLTVNQLGTVTINNFNIKPNTKEDATVSNSTQMGSVATQTTLANITFTSNTQASYVCSASSNSSTAYRAFGTSASNWVGASTVYSPTGEYIGSSFIQTVDNKTVYGEYVQIQLPSSYVLKGASWTNPIDSQSARTLTYSIYGSAIGTQASWYVLYQGNTGGSSTTTVTDFDIISQFTYLVYQIKTIQDGGTGFGGEPEVDAFTITGFNYTELIYMPQTLEIGDSTTATIPATDNLTVNGSARFKGLVINEEPTTLNKLVDGDANYFLTGYLLKYKKITAKVTVSNSTAFTANTSFWASTRSPTVSWDTTASAGVPTGYGMIITAGTYNGMYRAYYAGYYKVCINGRCADTTAANIGVMPKTYNGSSFVNIFPDDGVVWVAPENTNRRSFNFSFDVNLNSGIAVFLTPFAGNNQNWATMSVEFVSST